MESIKEIIGNDFYFHHSISDKPNTKYYKLHTHNAFEIYLFLGGKCSFIIEGNYYLLEPWDLIIVNPGEFHRVSVEEGIAYDRKIIRFDYSFLRPIDPENILLLPFLNKTQKFNVIPGNIIKETLIPSIYEKIEELTIYDYTLQRITMIGYITEILFEITKLYNSGKMTILIQYPNRKITDIINYINENLTEDLSLENISKQFFISKFYLSRLFKENTGTSIGSFTLKKRLLLAQRLINGGSTTSSACFSSGFSDYSSFYKGYKKYFGISPSRSNNSVTDKLTL